MRLPSSAILLLAACGGGSGGDPPPARETAGEAVPGPVRPDTRTAVLVVVESLGREHLACYGASRDVTPNLSLLAEEAIVFGDLVAVCTGANAGMATLLTGQGPARHGVCSLGHRGQQRLAEERVTLAEALGEAGWSTFAAVSMPQLGAELSGFDQGFDSYLAPGLHEGDRDAESTWYNALPELRTLFAGDEPAFVLLQLADPGALDAAPGADGVRFLEQNLGPFREERPELAALLDRAPQDPAGALDELAKLLGRGRGSSVHLAWRTALYESRLAVVDRVLGELRELLLESGRAESALVAVTATRGALLAPPVVTGGPAFPPPLIELPLVMRLPGGGQAGSLGGVTSALDLAPTLAELCGVSLEGDGRSRVSELGTERAGGVVRVLSPGLEVAALVSEDLVIEENRIAGLAGWRRDGTRLLRKSAEGAEVDAFVEAERVLGAEGRAGEVSWLVVESGGREDLRVTWSASSGFLGVTLLEQDETRALKSRGLVGSAGFDPSPGRLRVRLGEREPALRVDLDLGAGPVNEAQIWIGACPLDRSHVPRLRDKGGASWPEGEAALAAFDDRSGGWWRLHVGEVGPQGREVEALVLAPSTAPRAAALEHDSGAEVTVTPVPGRSDAVWVRGETPLEVSFQRPAGAQEFALSIHVDGVALPGSTIRYGPRRMAESGQVSLLLPDWIDGVTGDLTGDGGRVLGTGHVRLLRTGPLLGQAERRPATDEQLDFIRKLGGGE